MSITFDVATLLTDLTAREGQLGVLLTDLARPVDYSPGQRKTATRGGNHSNPEYYQWRKAVLERDSYKCRECGSDDRVTAHHINPWARHPELRYDLNNGVTLCRKCHAEKHPHMRWMNRQ